MRYIVETQKSPADAVESLRAAAAKHGFGVLHSYDLQETLASKGFPLGHACHVLDVCNPRQASRVLTEDIGMNVALPCRISVYEENGSTMIATILPTKLLASLSPSSTLAVVAQEVEDTLIAIMHDAA